MAHGQSKRDSLWRIDGSVAFGILQEQAKNESGQSGGRLFQSVSGALLLSGGYRVLCWLDGAVFVMLEAGNRSAAEFGGVDSRGVPTTLTRAGGTYTMVWIGPLLRAHWRTAFLEVAYVAFGVRDDAAYPALTSSGGSTEELFRTDPLRAWMFAPGMRTSLADNLDLTLKIEYRFLYYNRRGERLANRLFYGTQAIRPHLGVSYVF
jgi:hypothetical protein